VIADVTDPELIQTILAHLKQRAPPGAAHREMPLQSAQNDLFTHSLMSVMGPGCVITRFSAL